ncbi:MAG: hypothetical protein A3E07_02050 [Candidatus Wildermuthbacteria bacterium RIFCSPHIGHO2_12_FULL_45_9]|uniref:DUF5667 domain-containing protein n=1 Tax=Candidatus Wildermuthbacteria bacterium RIFCSPHIGHO2_02_FULL_45_25 TaxID=1802450 RepID=A0A1G2R491_9BACT|nr:MAG: hypothetical protein A2748_00540 [Candidatus Wildermuthbacteria bacterium RIFCSPHIGHO2_01_FULL_45_20]OHA67670.1 MAG: hypothetical protein A3C04_02000 [Candidatus Wildermuthbacteria bacterium RIFCSPHIGHO2_02_FULL_45_25]OHA70987.1 MAG: hypothetical protein A3E07_02050 [Candidatus Wildermuthbacteria bacterium RIFCSPHIGHO2_12_FULL_45_9]
MKRIIFLMAIMALAIGQSVHAQIFDSLRVKEDAENHLKEAQNQMNEKTERAMRENAIHRVSKIEKETVKAFNERREMAKDQVEKKKEEFKAKLEAKREEVKTRLEEKREEVKKRLEGIKDSKKRKTAEHLYDALNKVNDRITKHFEKVTDKLTEAVERIEQRADKAAANGQDVAEVRAKIAEAKAAIEAARSSVQTQAGKVYEFQADNAQELKTDIQAERDRLRADLEAVKTSISLARDAAHESLKSLAKIPRVDELEVEDSETEIE